MQGVVKRIVVAVSFILIPFAVAGCGGGGSGNGGALDPPTGVTAQGADSQVRIAWPPVSGATGYNIYWATAPGVTRANGNPIPGAVSPHVHGGLTNGTTYYYVVTSLRNAAEGPESAEVSATPYALVPPTVVTAAPADKQVTIDWTQVPGATSYNLYWSMTAGVTVGTGNRITGAVAPFVHRGLTNGTPYYYVVTSLQGTVESAESAEVSATPHFFVQGVLDTTFGGFGRITHDNAAGGSGADIGRDVIVDGQGRILVAGSSLSASTGVDMVLWRLWEDGTLDPNFNSQGWVVHNGAAGGGSLDEGWGLILDASGRILVVGQASNPLLLAEMVVWAFDTNGVLDPAFGAGGVAVHSGAAGGGGDNFGRAVVIDAWGRILVAGSSMNASGNLDMVVWGLDSSGALDPTFGNGGVLVHDGAAGSSDADEARAIAIDPGGYIVVAGYSTTLATAADMVVWRCDPTGALDGTFGTGGAVVHDGAASGGNDDIGEGVAIHPSGRIVVAGESEDVLRITDMAIWAYDPTGLLDPAFGSGGVVVHDNAAGGGQFDFGRDLLFDNVDRILVTGASLNSALNFDMVIWCYDASGALDPAFGTAGIVVHDSAAGGSLDDLGEAMTRDGNDRIVVTGSSWGTNPDMTVWRYR